MGDCDVSTKCERGGRGGGGGGGEGAPIHTPIIRLETAEKHQMYCLMSSDNPGLRQESNLQPLGYQPTAVTTELLGSSSKVVIE